MRSVSLCVVLGLALALNLSATPATAQVVGSGTIEIIVLDPNGSGVPGVLVTVEAADTTTRRTVTTDAAGRATIQALEPSADYIVTTQITGFNTQRREKVLVRSGQVTSLSVGLTVGGVSEEVRVTAQTPLVDTTTATRGQDITLQLTESLPTGRSYQSYLQLVPGVAPDDPKKPGNPASKSGINYSDIGGDVGVSSDNFYYFNGINVTDGQTGTFGANLNTEIIQEQKVLTGAIPAEYVGAAGLLTNVVTKSGSNQFHGSANYFFQNDNLVAENENSTSETFSSFDTALTLGGPIARNKAWFFGSYRRLERTDDVTALDTLEFLRTVDNTQDQAYAKGTWAATPSDTVSVTFLNDPTDLTGRTDRDLTNALDRARVQGGNRFGVSYQRIQGTLLFDGAFTFHDGEVTDIANVREPLNAVKYLSTDVRTLFDEQRGGFGSDIEDIRSTRGVSGSVLWLKGAHSVKAGAEFMRYGRFLNSLTVGGAQYTSIASHLAGASAAEIATGSYSQSLRFDPFNSSDFGGFIRTIDAASNRASFYAAFDGNADGTITPEELGASLLYTSSAGNPNGQINYFRIDQTQDGAQDFKADGLSFFVQDTFRMNRLTLNVGVRTEQWKHFASEGTKIFTFDWALAPRLSAIYDLNGDGRQKLFAFYGRYYDPVRTNMTAFAGSISGRVREEQVFANGEWVTYRTRGGTVSQDAFIAPTTKTPYTDDVEVGYEVDMGRNMSAEVTYSHRRTRDILEDYDHRLYSINYPGPTDDPNTLFLPPSYFGYDEFPAANFFIATLEGGKRNYNGIEFVLRKRYSNRWQGLLSYTYSDAKGNSNSDSNADFQGDVLYLDPRAPNQYGRQPGSIKHLFKMGGSYDWPFGLQLGFGYRWNSGTVASRTFASSGRNLPLRVTDPFDFAGINFRWLAEDSVGSLTNPSWGQVDLRAQYVFHFGTTRLETFVDVFNVTDNQGSTRDQDLVAGTGGIAFGDPIRFVDPRRFFLGARVAF